MLVDEETAPIVWRIFHDYSTGKGFTEIASGLTNEHIPSPRGADRWSPQTIRAILANKIYAGEYVSGKERLELHKRRNMPEDTWIRIQDHHEAIIPRAEFDAVQERLVPREYVRRTAETENYGELMGIAFCGQCDRPLLNKNGKYFCKSCGVEADEQYFYQRLVDTALKYQATLPDVQKMNRTRLSLLAEPNAMVETAKEDYKRAWDDYEKWYRKFCDGVITFEEFSDKKPVYADRCKEAEEIRDKAIEERANLDQQLKECRDFVRESKKLKRISDEDDLKLVHTFISKAMLTRDGDDRRLMVEVRMAAEIASHFEWWDGYKPEMIMVEER